MKTDDGRNVSKNDYFQELKTEIDKLRSANLSYDNQVRMLKAENDTLKKKNLEKTNEIGILREKLESMESSKDVERTENRSLIEKLKSVIQKNEELEKQLETLREIVPQFENTKLENTSLLERVEKQEAELKRMSDRNSILENKTAVVMEIEEENRTLKDQIKEMNEKIIFLQKEEKELEMCNTSVKKKDFEIDLLKGQVEDAKIALNMCKETLDFFKGIPMIIDQAETKVVNVSKTRSSSKKS
ncbi:MAG: hypothetical protein ACYCPR_10075 [Thermoplasmataceae archaeon]|jgi:predicted RNase H-like nuclease (RuvC/YqgF family)